MKKRQIAGQIMASALALGMLLGGCGSSESATAPAYDNLSGANAKSAVAESFAMPEEEAYEEMDYEETTDAAPAAAEGGESASQSESVATNRKLIKRVNLTAETQEFDKLTRFIEKRVEELGGYMESSDVYSGSLYNGGRTRNASYTARVPVAKMNELVNAVGENSNITNKSESAEDVTLEYVDNKSRKEALEVEMDRLMEILKQADDVDTIIELERRITDVRYEIQNLESRLRTYDNLVDFATVNITVTEVEVYTPEPVKKQSDWERMTQGFMHSLKSLGRGILDFLIAIVIDLPYLILWGGIIAVIVLIVRKFIKGKDKRAEKRAAKKAKKEAAAAERAAAAAAKRAQNAGQTPGQMAPASQEKTPELNRALQIDEKKPSDQ
ncbi:MAG: DUF4349 domain-containing protein [Lachnospiraceae bacterium]|nr:DUF4349 domain-containing protein [Lachnospiraceae bacterium]